MTGQLRSYRLVVRVWGPPDQLGHREPPHELTPYTFRSRRAAIHWLRRQRGVKVESFSLEEVRS